MHAQVSQGKDVYLDLWLQIINRKISNQARALSIMGMEGAENISKYLDNMTADNIDITEALSAKEYFTYYHEGLNRRGDDPENSRLNYGYAVVRSYIARSLVAAGFHPTFGLILMSADRHYGNMSLIRGENEDYRFAPIYDNGSCLLAEDSYSDTDGYWDKKLNLPFGPQLFGFFPVKHYIKLCKKHSNENNRISVNPENIESFIEKYNCEYYSEEKVEKIKWLLWDNIEFYNELEIIDYEDQICA